MHCTLWIYMYTHTYSAVYYTLYIFRVLDLLEINVVQTNTLYTLHSAHFHTIYTYTSMCTVIRTFLAIFQTAPKSYATIFLGYRGPYIGPTNTNHTIKKKCHFLGMC